jgi:hypothetical protein
MSERRFPPPWTVEETDACFVVADQQRAETRLRIFRGTTAASLDNEDVDQGRGAADRGELRQVAGLAATRLSSLMPRGVRYFFGWHGEAPFTIFGTSDAAAKCSCSGCL